MSPTITSIAVWLTLLGPLRAVAAEPRPAVAFTRIFLSAFAKR